MRLDMSNPKHFIWVVFAVLAAALLLGAILGAV